MISGHIITIANEHHTPSAMTSSDALSDFVCFNARCTRRRCMCAHLPHGKVHSFLPSEPPQQMQVPGLRTAVPAVPTERKSCWIAVDEGMTCETAPWSKFPFRTAVSAALLAAVSSMKAVVFSWLVNWFRVKQSCAGSNCRNFVNRCYQDCKAPAFEQFKTTISPSAQNISIGVSSY